MISFDKIIVHQLNKLSAACSTFQEHVESAVRAFSYKEKIVGKRFQFALPFKLVCSAVHKINWAAGKDNELHAHATATVCQKEHSL